MNPTAHRFSRRVALQRGLALAGGASLGLGALGRMGVSARTATNGMGALVSANLDFGFRLYAALAKQAGTQNLFLSPLSIALAMDMVYNGARSTTQQAMAQTLGLGSMDASSVNAAAAALLAELRGLDPNVSLSIADALWLRKGYSLVPAYQQALKATYGAEARILDFADPRTPATINAWVSQQTHGLIPAIVKAIPPQMVLYLVNALYFKAAWTSQFHQSATGPGPFTGADGRQKTLPMMRNTGSYAYAKTTAYEAIRMPYAAEKFAMYIFLPSVASGLRGFQSGLDAATWAKLLTGLTPHHGTIVLPRFTVQYTKSLVAALSALGMGIAFDRQRADLSGMVQLNGDRAYISEVQHKTVMEVNEQGTRAAAVTSVGVGVTAMPASSFTMTVNRPFFCAIRDETTGSLLFMGAITDPQA